MEMYIKISDWNYWERWAIIQSNDNIACGEISTTFPSKKPFIITWRLFYFVKKVEKDNE